MSNFVINIEKFFFEHVVHGGCLWNVLIKIICLKKKARENSILLKKNLDLKDLCKDKRCFILGNGPSLKDVDLNLLKNEDVFTVNCMMEYKYFDMLKPKCHFWMDLNGFGMRNEVGTDPTYFFNLMKKLKGVDNIKFFVPAVAFEVIKRENIDDGLDVRYLWHVESGKKIKKIDISKFSLPFGTVVQYAIETAIYMGYSEIYLLGCDTTVIKGIIDTALDLDINGMHVYDEDNNETQKKSFKKLLSANNGIRFALKDTLNVLNGYDVLNSYCEINNIKLINLSSVTLIDSIKRDSIEAILGNNK